MNIAFCSKQLPSDAPNGVSVQVHRLANALCQRGHQVTVFSFSPLPDGASYALFKLRYPCSLPLLKKFLPAIMFARQDFDQFDIVHFHGDDFLVSDFQGKVRTYYGSALFEALHAKTIGRFMYQSLFYVFELLSLVQTRHRAAISKKTTHVLPGPMLIIPCGVPEYFTHSDTKSDNPEILFIGDFDSRKRGRVLVSIFQQTIQPRLPDAQLTIIGPRNIAAPGITCKWNLTDSEMVHYYQKAWVLCVLSSYEGFGVPVIEAMACQTPVVAVRNDGVAEIVVSHRNGILCQLATFADMLMHLLEDSRWRMKLSLQAQKDVAGYRMQVIAQHYENLYVESKRQKEA